MYVPVGGKIQGQLADYKRFPIFSDEALYNDLKTIFSHDITAQLHVNGDAAIDQAIRVIGKLKNEGLYKLELRAALMHVQNSRPDHIAKIKEIGVIPSYFSSHVYLLGGLALSKCFWPTTFIFYKSRAISKKCWNTFYYPSS